MARTLIRKKRLNLLAECLERANNTKPDSVNDFELQNLISTNYEASVVVEPFYGNHYYNFFMNLKLADAPLETHLLRYNVSNVSELLQVAKDEDKVKFAISYYEDPQVLANLLETVNQYDPVAALNCIFKHHLKSEKLYDWVRILALKANGMDLGSDRKYIYVENCNANAILKLMTDSSVINGPFMSSFQIDFSDREFFLQYACRLESSTELIIQNPEVYDKFKDYSYYNILKCHDEKEIERLLRIYLVAVPVATVERFFQKLINRLNESGIDTFPSFELALKFWKSKYPEGFEQNCPILWKNALNSN